MEGANAGEWAIVVGVDDVGSNDSEDEGLNEMDEGKRRRQRTSDREGFGVLKGCSSLRLSFVCLDASENTCRFD